MLIVLRPSSLFSIHAIAMLVHPARQTRRAVAAELLAAAASQRQMQKLDVFPAAMV